MAEMHVLKTENESASKRASIWEKTEKFMDLMPKKFAIPSKQAK